MQGTAVSCAVLALAFWVVACGEDGTEANGTADSTESQDGNQTTDNDETAAGLVAPTGLRALDGTAAEGIFLSWDPVAGATAYDLIRDGEVILRLEETSTVDLLGEAAAPDCEAVSLEASRSQANNRIDVRWQLEDVAPEDREHAYQVAAVDAEERVGPESDAKTGRLIAPTLSGVSLRAGDGGPWLPQNGVSVYMDLEPPYVLTAGRAVATEGRSSAGVSLQLEGWGYGPDGGVDYTLRVDFSDGQQCTTEPVTGRLAEADASQLSFQWEWAEGDGPFRELNGLTTEEAFDNTASESGDHRTYRCVVTAPLGDPIVSESAVGWRSIVTFTGGFAALEPYWADDDPPVTIDLGSVEEDIAPTWTMGYAADFDGDGTNELVASSVTYVEAVSRSVGMGVDGDQLEAIDWLEIPSANIQAVVDLDGDNHVDLFAQPVDAWTVLGYGRGDGSFDWPDFGLSDTELFPQGPGINIADIDDDGWLDLLVVNELCDEPCLNCFDASVLLRTGLRHYTESHHLFTDHGVGPSCALWSGNLGGDRVMIAAGERACSSRIRPNFYRMSGLDADGYPLWEHSDGPITGERNEFNNWASMGAAGGDLNGDGHMDLIVSAQEGTLSYQGAEEFPLVETSDLSVAWQFPGDLDYPMIAWGLAIVDFDRDGLQDMLVTNGMDNWEMYELIGPEWVTLYWNQGGDWHFEEVSTEVGLDRRGDTMSLTIDDIDRDGNVDFLVGGQMSMPVFYRNEVDGPDGTTIRLIGTTSNHLGMGARLLVEPGNRGRTQHYEMNTLGSPNAVSTPLVFAAPGSEGPIERVTITWPTGLTQVVHDVPSGYYVIEEPISIKVEPAGRHLEAGGEERAVVRAWARLPDGSVDRTAEVTLRLAYGTGEVDDGMTQEEDGGWRFDVIPPAEPGTGVLEVSIDGEPLLIRPRIWWD